jgi:hypothetical protein
MDALMNLPNDLKDFTAEEDRGVLGFLREVFGTLLGAFAIVLLVIVALGWA